MSGTLELLNRLMSLGGSTPVVDAVMRPSSKEIQKPKLIKPVRDNTIAYSHVHRGQWHKPEYDFERHQVAQDTDSFYSQTINQRVTRFTLSGYEFVSENPEVLLYVKQRAKHMELAMGRPWRMTFDQWFQDLARFRNLGIVKKRDNKRSMGRPRKHHTLDYMIEPVAGYFTVPFERLEFKSNANGTFKRVRELMPDGKHKDYKPADFIHMSVYKKPGFTTATPEFQSGLDDILMLRRIEENVIELIETQLFPRYHYKVGTDDHPALYTMEGEHEVDYVRRMISYMPPGAIYVSDHRQEIEVLGAENTALRIDYYLNYFRERVFAALGTSGVDMGIGGSASRSTASTLSKQTLMAVEALQIILSEYINFYIINEWLLEAGFNPMDPDHRVEIRFGIVDKEERIAVENQVIQKFVNNLINHPEARKELGYPPANEEWMAQSYYKLFAEPLALSKASQPGSAANHALASAPQSNISQEGVTHEEQFTERQAKLFKAQPSGTQGGSTKSKTNGSSANKSRPRNQHGTRSSPKLTKDVTFDLGDRLITTTLDFDYDVDDSIIDDWTKSTVSLYDQLRTLEVRFESVLRNQLPKLHKLHEDSHD